MTAPTGELLARFKKSGKSARGRAFLWCLMLAVTQSAIGVLNAPEFPARPLPLTELIFVACFIASVAGIIFDGLRGIFTLDETLEVHSDGFILRRPRKCITYTWAELEAYYLFGGLLGGGEWDRSIPLSLKMADGKLFVFGGSWRNGRDIAWAVAEASTATLLDRTLSQLEAGQEVDFGTITVTSGGFRVGDRSLALEDVAEIAIRQANPLAASSSFRFVVSPRVRGKKKGKLPLPVLFRGSLRLEWNKIPNVFVLWELIQRFAPNLQRDEEGQALDSGDNATTELATDSGGMKSSQEHSS